MKWLLPLTGALIISGASAQGVDLTGRDRLIASFKRCVTQATAEDTAQANIRLSVENAFLACSTEEQAIRSWFELSSVRPALAQAFIVRIKLDLKHILIPQ